MVLRLLRKLLIVLIFLSFAGCGDCGSLIDPNNFIPDDVFPSDVPDFGPKIDARDKPDVGGGSDTGFPKDVDFKFDFGRPDQDALPFAIHTLVPESGPVAGGNLVRIVGESLLAETKIFIGSQQMEVDLVGGNLIGRVPPGSGPGPITVKAIAPDGEIRALVDAYTYVENLRIDSISPSLVPTQGGSEIEIRGAGFRDPIGVSFSREDALHVQFIDDGLLRVTTPPRPRGFADLRLTTFSESAVKIRALQYFDPLEIERIEPASGLSTGGDVVTLFGKGFTTNTKVKFDTIDAEIISVDINAGSIRLRTPPHAVGLSDLFLSNARSADVLKDGFYFRLNGTPRIENILPNSGPESGANSVRIIGFGLDDANASFTFSAAEATIQNATPTFVDVIVPPGSGSVDLRFSISGNQVNTLIGAYTYLHDLSLISISPNTGQSGGGTEVTFSGQGFTDVDEVKFDSISVPFTVISDTEIRATTLSHPGAIVDVSIHREGLRSVLVDAFTFTSDLEIWGFSPTAGARAGGTNIHIRGDGFFGAVEVTLDGISGENIQRLDRNNIVFFSPPHASGNASLKVKIDTKSAEGPYPYLYFEPASRFGGASGNEVNGSVNVTVFSLGEGPLEDAFVMLSTRAETQYQGFTDANGQITLSGIDVIGAQTTTATAAGYSTATLQTVDAENITILLNQLDPMPGSGSGNPPPEARIFGTITAEGKLADPDDQDTYNMAVVRTTQLGTGGASFPPPGNNSVVIGQRGRFDIRARVGDLALIGLCGTFHQPTGVFTPEFLAVERFIFLGDKEELEVDLSCDIPLDQTHRYKITNSQFAPSGPDINRVQVFWDFGFEGVFPSRVDGFGLGNIIEVDKQPEPKGKVSDINFISFGGSFTGLGAPFTRSSVLEVSQPQTIIELPTLMDVPHALQPLPGGVVENNQISFAGGQPFVPDFYVGFIRNERGIIVYQFFLPGNETTFVMPTFPDFSALPVDKRPFPLTQGPLNITIIAAKMRAGHVYESFSYRDIDPGLWEAYAQNSWAIRLPLP